MGPESKVQDSRLVTPADNTARTSSQQYSACASIKRTNYVEIDPEIIESFSTDFDLLPLVEEKIHNYKFMKQSSLETNELLKCRWKAYKDCVGKQGSKKRVPFQFPNADDIHFYNFHTRYIPSQSLAGRDFRFRLTHDQRLDERGHRPLPIELQIKRTTTLKTVAAKPKPEAKPKKGGKMTKTRTKVQDSLS